MSNRFLPTILQICATALAVAAVALFFFDFRQTPDITLNTLPRLLFLPLIAVALAIGLASLASVLLHQNDGISDLSRSVSQLQVSLADVEHKLNDAYVALDRLSRNRAPAVTAPPPPMQVTAHLAPNALEPLFKLLNEIRDLSLMTEAERQGRLREMEHERRLMLVRQAIEYIELQRFAEADSVLRTLESEHADDADVKRTRQQFQDARRNAEPASIERGREVIENFINVGSWDQAFAASQRLMRDFPGNIDAQNLAARVAREREHHVETSVARMVEEIRHDIDRRLWRRALLHAQRLIELFPQHAKTQRIGEQLATLRENAEIEERQELEVRIQELVRARNFSQAITVAEELLARFPTSPQAEQIEVLLPRIRQLQAEGDSPVHP